MDSYTFSSDSTSSFFIKETPSDENLVNMNNITDSILQLNTTEDVHPVVSAVDDNAGKVDSNCEHNVGNRSSDEVFVITIGTDNASHESVKSSACNNTELENVEPEMETKDVSVLDESGVSEDVAFTNAKVEESEALNERNIDVALSFPDECSGVTEENNILVGDQQDNDNTYDEDDDHFDMEQFLSSKTDKKLTGFNENNGKTSKKKNAIMKKYFTDCGSNSVKCNLCSDVLLSNHSNLVLHLRHVHKTDKSEMNFAKAWEHFTKVDSFKAKCNLCSNSFIYRNRMSTLVKHLRDMHRETVEPDLTCESSADDAGNVETSLNSGDQSGAPSDVIVIQNSDGKLINQIKVNKSWKCFTKLPNSDKMICNLCKKIFTHNKTDDLLQHLHEEHTNLLSTKQQANQLLVSAGSSNAEELCANVVYDHTPEVSRSVIIQKVLKHPVRLGKSAKNSKIWEYFSQINSEKIKCNLCSKVLANNYSTSNLLRHLSARHTEAYNIIKELASSETDTIKIVIQDENGQPEKDVSVADMLEDYENMLTPNEVVHVGEMKPKSKIKQPMSETWNYYTKLEEIGKVRCNICQIMLAYTDGISSNLTRHLKAKHKILFGKGENSFVDANSLIGGSDYQEDDLNLNKSDLESSKHIDDDTSKLESDELKPTDNTLDVPESTTDDVQNADPKLAGNSPVSVTKLESDTVDGNNDGTNSESNNTNQRSKAWDYFQKVDSENKVICNICSLAIPFVNSSTYKLFRHLSVKHSINYKKQPKTRKVFAYESDSSDEEPNKEKGDEHENKVDESMTEAHSAAQLSEVSSDNDNGLNTSCNDVKKSEIKVTGRTWKHFTKLDRDKAKCNICGNIFTYKLGQTSHLIKHIQMAHKEIDSKCSEDVVNAMESKRCDETENLKPVKSFVNNPTTIWKYFTKLKNCKVLCNLCEVRNVLSHSRSSNLIRHLNNKHRDFLETSSEENTSIQMSDVRSCNKQRDDEIKTFGDCRMESEDIEDSMYDALNDMQSLYEYLISDEKLKSCIKFEDNQIKCKICSGSFVCNNPINYEYTIRYHVQIFHAEWTVMCFDETMVKRECVSPVSVHEEADTSNEMAVPDSNYNELEAIANEVSSFMHFQDPPVRQFKRDNGISDDIKSNKNTVKSVNDDIWKYFTKLTSQNVRCNFCSILLSFKQHKKWNLVRHLKLKHRSKINGSFFKKSPSGNQVKKGNLRSTARPVIGARSNASNKSSLKKSSFRKPIRKSIGGDSIMQKIKPKPVISSALSEPPKNNKVSAVKKTSYSAHKSNNKKSSLKDKSDEKKSTTLSSFITPINRKIGRTWSHFTKIEMGKAQCNICCNVLLYRGNGLDLLNEHLTGKHLSFFDGSGSESQKSCTKKINFDMESSESEDSELDDNNRVEKDDREKDPPKPKRIVKNEDEDYVDNSEKQQNRVWQYFTKSGNGYGKCHLCLSEISYRGSTNNLMRHLQKIHSVISLLTPEKMTESEDTENEQTKLLAAVDLTPTRVLEKSHVCFIRINKNMVRCNFCPRILFHKCGNMHKLMSHFIYKHEQEAKKYESLKDMKFVNKGKDVILVVNEKQEKLPVSSDNTVSSEMKADKRKVYRSNTWLYFTKLDEHYAKCNICFKSFSYKGGSIYNLTRHLLIKHGVKLIKRFEMSSKKFSAISLGTPKSSLITRKKSETLSFYRKINRNIVKCKLCMKRLTYSGVTMNRLIAHLWSSHIKKLIEIGGSHHPNLDNVEDEKFNFREPSVVNDSVVDGNVVNIHEERKKGSTTGKKTSSTWNYFTDLKDAEKNMQCNICQKIFCFKSGNLSNLSRHLEQYHGIKKISSYNNEQTSTTSNSSCDLDSTCSERIKLRKINTNDLSSSKDETIRNEIYAYFLKTDNSGEVQCKFCPDILKLDNLTDLKAHLSSNHEIQDFLSKTCKNELQEGLDINGQPNDILLKSVSLESRNALKLKCKLCYKELISRHDNVISILTEHLKTIHEELLNDDEKCLLQENVYVEQIKDDKMDVNECVTSVPVNTVKTGTLVNMKLSNMVLGYFKNLKTFKSKCKICNKFISPKRPCYHRITNDLSIKYSVYKRKSNGINVPEKKIKKDVDVEKVEKTSIDVTEIFKKTSKYKVKHFMSVNLHDNKCYDCMASRHVGYCIHSLNSWIMNENKNFESTKLAGSYNNQVSLNPDEVQIIADSFNGCSDNNIIIITDNDDTLNYDITNRSETGAQDISYHIMNSINDIDDDDIKVIIYNYNSESTENENSDMKQVSENNVETSSNKALEEHISNIVKGLSSSSQIMYNVENSEDGKNLLKDKNCTDDSTMEQISENVITDNSSTLNSVERVEENSEIEFRRSYDLEKLTELAEVSCNEQFYKRNSLMNSTEQSSDVHDPAKLTVVKTPEINETIGSVSSDRCIVETIYPENGVIEGKMAIEKEFVMHNVVYKSDIESCEVETCLPKLSPSSCVEPEQIDASCKDALSLTEVHEPLLENTDASNRNQDIISEDVINAIFNEVIVNLQENPEEKEMSLIKLNDDNIEIPQGLYLQNLKSMYKISKIVLYFSNINYVYKTAKCNLCKMYLEFVEPLIYNLLMHLFTNHKDKVCTDEPINKALTTNSTTVDSSNKPRRKSPVWKYFVNEKNFRAICKICRFSFSYKGGAINNLSRHLRLRHSIIVSSKSAEDPNYDVNYVLSYPKRRSAVKLRSKTWKYFSKEPNDWAKCRICKKYLSYRSSTINNLTRHLRTIHSKIFNSLFTDKDPVFIKNEDGSLTENFNFMNNEENSEVYNSLMMETSVTKSRDEILQQCSYSSLENNRRKSIVWNYFSEITQNYGKCNFCSKVISCKGGGTSNLSRHLRSKHGIWIVLTSNLSQSFNESMNDPELNMGEDFSAGRTADVNDTIITQEQLHILKNRKLVNKRSKTWEYFTKEGVDRVRCNLCSKQLSYKCKAVHNLRRHLAKKHPSCVVKPDPVRLKLQISTQNDVLHNSNEIENPLLNESDKKFIDITDTSVVIVDEETQLPPHRPDRNSRPKKSIVWNYFRELEYGIAKCLICSKILSFRGGGTNNLMRHLRCRHSIIIVNQSVGELSSLEREMTVNDCDKDDNDLVNESVNTEQEDSEETKAEINSVDNTEDT